VKDNINKYEIFILEYFIANCSSFNYRVKINYRLVIGCNMKAGDSLGTGAISVNAR